MADLETLVVTLTAETSELKSQLKGAQVTLEKSTQSMTKAIDTFSKDSKKSTSTFQDAWATMLGFIGGQAVLGAVGVATDIFKGLFNSILVEGVKAASESQVAMNNLLNAIARSGQSAKGASADFGEFADSLQRTTQFGDDAVLSAAALLSNLTRLDKEGLKGATKSTVDFAAAMNIDLNTAANVVGKAIEGNVGALGRYGIKVEEGTTKAQTFANVMQALNSRFGGAAASQLNTFAGATTALGNTWEDFTKVFGNAVVENKSFINIINTTKNIIADFTSSFSPQQIREFFSEALLEAANFGVGIASVFQTVTKLSRDLMDSINQIGVMIGATAAAAMQAASGDFAGAAQTVSDAWNEASAEFEGNDSSPVLDKITESMVRLQSAAQAGAVATAAGLTAIAEPAANAGASIDGVTEKLTASQEAAKGFAESILESSTSIQDSYALQLEQLVALKESEIVTEEEFAQMKLDLLATKQAEEQALLAQGLALKNASITEQKAAELQLSKQQSAELAKVEAEKTKAEQKEQKLREQNFGSTLGVIAGLASSNNKTLAGIGKAAAITQATIDGFAAVQKALASAPPPFNFALAGLVGVATAANVSKIAGTPLATGIDSVPGIGSSDNFPAMLAPGERVVPAKTNEDLTAFLEKQSSGQGITINVVMNDVFTSDPREMGLKIINTINETAQANGVKILGSSVA